MRILSLLSYAIKLIYWSVLGCNSMDSSDHILKLPLHNCGLRLGLVKWEPGTEIPPHPSSHQKEVMNFKTPRCKRLKSDSVTSKNFSVMLWLSGDRSRKSLLWLCFDFRSLHKDSIQKSFKCIREQEAVSPFWSFFGLSGTGGAILPGALPCFVLQCLVQTDNDTLCLF